MKDESIAKESLKKYLLLRKKVLEMTNDVVEANVEMAHYFSDETVIFGDDVIQFDEKGMVVGITKARLLS